MMKKNILFVGTSFFGIQKEIIVALEDKGFNVDFFVMSEPRGIVLDIATRLFSWLDSWIQDKYYQKVWSKIKLNNYNYVFIIKGDAVPLSFLKQVRQKNNNARFILYLWDSVKNMNQIPDNRNFDAIYTFDRKDAVMFNFLHMPLFYLRQASDVYSEAKYTVSLLATLHSDRLYFAKYFSNLLSKNEKPSFFYIYAPVRSLIVNFIMGRVRYGFKNITIKKLPLYSVDDYTLKSSVILDFPHIDQAGLTLRLMSAIGMKKHIITTNNDVTNYNFYDRKYILVIDKTKLVANEIKEFICNSDKVAHYSNIEPYYLPNWLDKLLNLKD